MYIVFPCIQHFTTYHLCCESLETVVDRKKNKRRVRKPTETEALPLHVDKRKLYIFNSEHVGKKICENTT